jgi:hypothetical protein
MKGREETAQNGKRSETSSQPADANPRSLTVESFGLSGTSDLPDPSTHAYRPDLADTALAGRVIASHYAEPLVRHLAVDAELLDKPGGNVIAGLGTGDTLRMLDCSRGWAWGYGPDGRVGYVKASAIAP